MVGGLDGQIYLNISYFKRISKFLYARLADEYLRLVYQGFRARDKSFNATFSTEFDNVIDKVNVVPQEIGRVLLNLINNAFYALNERSKEGILGHEPTVSVATRRLQDRIEISVKDNGNGISASIKEKIFQPFLQQNQQAREQDWA